MVYGARLRPSRGVNVAAVIGVLILMLTPVLAPFTAQTMNYSSSGAAYVAQNFQGANYASAVSFDDWSLSSGVYIATSTDIREAQEFALTEVLARGWDEDQFMCLVNLWNRESHWNYRAHNVGSGAYGIPQALPGSKMASAGSDWETNPRTQIRWGLGYIGNRYGSPCDAWQHSQDTGWY